MELTADDLRPAFRQVFGQDPYDFQVSIAQHLLAGRDVICRAPTGSGKTRGALFPFVHTWRSGLAFPRKCLYAVPMRVLANQFRQDADDIGEAWGTTPPKITLQTGEQQDDRTFEGDMIFTTIDQVLSSFLNVPYSLSRRRANLNAGAVLSSYLIADEVHLFPLDARRGEGAFATLVELLAEFNGLMPFLLMTATLSDEMVRTLQRQLGCEIVEPTECDRVRLQQSLDRVRTFHLCDEPLSAERILREHVNRSLVVCNQVERAYELYDQLLQAKHGEGGYTGIEIELLHSRFLKSHRRVKEDWIRGRFSEVTGVAVQRTNSIVVATQAIEVGLNISCDKLHTELAPANSIVQRAGRCARFRGERGDVAIYRLPTDEGNPYLPYEESLCEATWTAFAKRNHEALCFEDGQGIVAVVHDAADLRVLQKVADKQATRWEQISRAMHQGTTEFRPTLIRRVDSRTLIVSADPTTEDVRPYAWQGFSVFHGTLRGWFKRIQGDLEGSVPGWWLRYPVEVVDQDQDARKRVSYRWDPVLDPSQIDVSPVFAVHPDLVAYDRTRGFRLVAGPKEDLEEQKPQFGAARGPAAPAYHLELYEDHIRRMLGVYANAGRRLQDQLLQASVRVERSLDSAVRAAQLEKAVLLAIALHDVAKCEIRWQSWARRYQEEIGEPLGDRSSMVAHTHYEPEAFRSHHDAEQALAKQGAKRPSHAAESAFACWPIIWEVLGQNELLCPAVFSAITRHHGPLVESFSRYELEKASVGAVGKALEYAGIAPAIARNLVLSAEPESLRSRLVQPDWPAQWAVYALLVRMLRLCDGHAMEAE